MSHPQVTPSEPTLSLKSVADHFNQWRSTRVKRGKIPEELMEQAFLLVDHYPMTKITKTLGLCFSQFRSRCLVRGLIQVKDRRSTVRFVEVHAYDEKVGILNENSIQMALSRADGASLKIAVSQVHAAAALMSQFLKEMP